ncbi:DNA topology modulation protein [Niallia sp. NCCP-28]|nr:DNA topology modulation protein [Niallia sp. NCCP-28]
MKRNMPDKVHIIGSVGSGKTTLARVLSKQYGQPYYELDNVVWKRGELRDVRRTDEERDAYLDEIVKTKRWIIEGSQYHNWVAKSFQHADIVILLDTPYLVRKYRITKRYIRQLLGIEEANYTPSFRLFKKMFEWNKVFETDSKPKLLKSFQQENMDFIILKDKNEVEKYFN